MRLGPKFIPIPPVPPFAVWKILVIMGCLLIPPAWWVKRYGKVFWEKYICKPKAVTPMEAMVRDTNTFKLRAMTTGGDPEWL